MKENQTKIIKLGKYIPEENLIWTDAFNDNIAGIKAFNQCIVLADVMEDKEPRLICADISCKLKVYKNDSLNSETKLQFTPVGIVSFYGANPSNPKTNLPYLAVAGGAYIFVYKHLKGTFKFLIPNIDPNPQEVQIWSDLKDGKIEFNDAINKLTELKMNMNELSTRSLELLALTDITQRQTFIEERKYNPIIITNHIVCISLLRKDALDTEMSLSQIVVGTESCFIYIIDQSGSKIIFKYKIPSIPFCIVTSGCYDIDYYIFIAGRDNIIYTIRQGELIGLQIEIPVKIFRIVKTQRSIIVGCIDSTIHSYGINGIKNFFLQMPSEICCMELLDIKSHPIFNGFMIGLKNGEFRIYSERNLSYVYKFTEPIFCIKFGNYSNFGRSFIFITESGGLIIKKMKYISIDNFTPYFFNSQGEEIPLSIPKKTKLYLDLIEREKEVGSSKYGYLNSNA